CSTEFEKIDGTVIAQKALSAVARTGQSFGLNYLIEFLRGSKSRKIRLEHLNLKTYGVGADISKDEWFAYFKDLIDQGYLRQTTGDYPTLALTGKSDEVLRGNSPVQLFKIIERHNAKQSLVAETSLPYFKDLFDELREKRLVFARNENVPPYVVFSDATLVEMATYLPQNAAEMQRISGVGDVKMYKYGADFLAGIREYCKKSSLASRIDQKSRGRRPKSRTKRGAYGDDTYTTTLKMFRSGISLAEIAQTRELAVSTIESHLARFIPTGEISLDELVPEHKVAPIRKAIIELNAEKAIEPVKELLGEDYSYGEIRAVAADFLRGRKS
ncbi:MAG: RQC domain-containing protein, partial [Pyrinomonadaceae bacterium]